MAAQLFLLTPQTAEPQHFPAALRKLLAAADVSALLVRRYDLGEAEYAALVGAILPVAQAASCAVLVDSDPALAISLGADGVHVPPDVKSVKAAIAALKPAMIVGAGPFTTRHAAMEIGELDVDYVLFGPLDGAPDPGAAEMASWWAQTFEVPAVYCDPSATPDQVDALGSEFIALSAGIWDSAAPEQAIAAFARTLEA